MACHGRTGPGRCAPHRTAPRTTQRARCRRSAHSAQPPQPPTRLPGSLAASVLGLAHFEVLRCRACLLGLRLPLMSPRSCLCPSPRCSHLARAVPRDADVADPGSAHFFRQRSTSAPLARTRSSSTALTLRRSELCPEPDSAPWKRPV